MKGPLYRSFFGFQREPFTPELEIKQILVTQTLEAFTERFDYVFRLGAIGLLTGEVGAGKSTALRFAQSRLHPAQYHPLWLTASSGSILETYRQLASALDSDTQSSSRSSLLPIILAGQNNLLDLLQYRSSLPLASRIVARSHLEGIDLEQMQLYLTHHLAVAGVKAQLLSPQAITAIQQGSAGLLRRANHLARGSLVAAANEKSQLVSPEHVRLANTELV